MLSVVGATFAAQPAFAQPAAPPPAAPAPAATAAAAPAPVAKLENTGGVPVEVHGSYFSRYEWRQNYDELGVSGGRFLEGDRAVYRFRTSLTTGPMDVGGDRKVIAHFAPQASGFYPGAGTAGNTNPTIGESDLGVVEGYLRLKDPTWSLDVGRFIMNYGISAVIGSLDWHQSARSFQGARFTYQLPEKAYVDAFFTQQVEGSSADPRFTGGDEYFAGIYSGLAPLVPVFKTFDVYALSKAWGSRSETATNPKVGRAIQTTVGTLIKGEAGPLDYILEGGLQFGKRRRPLNAMTMATKNDEVLAYNIDAEIGVKVAKGLRVAGYGAYVSGEDGKGKVNSWDELYPTTHAFFGLTDVMGQRTNIADGAFRASYAATEKTMLRLDFHNFFRPEDYNLARMGKQSGYAGSEADMHLIQKLGKGLVARALYGVFIPGSDMFYKNAMATEASDKTAHYVEVELRYDF